MSPIQSSYKTQNAQRRTHKPSIIIITGQTATGKTGLAIKKALLENGELINADSRQVYKHLDIITGKDLPPDSAFHEAERKNNFSIGYYPLCHSERSKAKPRNPLKEKGSLHFGRDDNVKLWLCDVVDPKYYFSSFDFESLAIPLIKNILERGKTPIIIGGTYFYIYHLLYSIETNVGPDWKLRKELDNKTVPEMQKMLKKLNPDLYKTLNNSDKNNPRRLMRKIEISEYIRLHKSTPLSFRAKRSEAEESLSDQTKGSLHFGRDDIMLSKKLGISNLNIEYIGLRFKNKDSLHTAIKKRVEDRLKNGAIDEVKKLLAMGYSENDPGLKTIGCKEIIKYLRAHNAERTTQNELSLEWQTREHQYAKKQNVFMKKDKNIKWKEIYSSSETK